MFLYSLQYDRFRLWVFFHLLLIQWRDLTGFFQCLGLAERLTQFILMYGSPFDDETSGSGWKVAFNE